MLNVSKYPLSGMYVCMYVSVRSPTTYSSSLAMLYFVLGVRRVEVFLRHKIFSRASRLGVSWGFFHTMNGMALSRISV